MHAHPTDILATYERQAAYYDAFRFKDLFEKPLLIRMMQMAPGPRFLDIGCGSGRPIGQFLQHKGAQVTGVDGAASMVRLFRRNVRGAPCHHRDMRKLKLGATFDAILAWDSFFHLTPNDQRLMFAIFRRHARPGTVLVISTGPEAGQAWGNVGKETVYHASLAPLQYRQLFRRFGFKVIDHSPNDARLDFHTYWFARFIS